MATKGSKLQVEKIHNNSTSFKETIKFALLHCNNFDGNNNKFYIIEIQKNNKGEYQLFSNYGRLGKTSVYEIRKYVKLLLKSNPNVLSLLWLPEHLYIYVSEIGQELINHRDLFLTKQAYHSYVGYSKGQLHRMTHINTSDLGAKRKALVKKFDKLFGAGSFNKLIEK